MLVLQKMSSRIRFLLPFFPFSPVPAGRFIYIPRQMLTVLKYIALIGTFFIYTTSGVFSKLASQREFLSPGYIAFSLRLGGRAGDLRRALAANYQTHARGRRLPVQGGRILPLRVSPGLTLRDNQRRL